MMTRAGGHRRVLLENLAHALERPKHRRARSVGDSIVWSRPTAFRPHEIIAAVLEEHERAFDVALRCDLLERCAIRKRRQAREVLIQFRNVAMPPTAVDQIKRSIAVLENKLIDRLGAIVKLINQRLAQVVFEWSSGLAGASDANTTNLLIVLNIIRAEEEVIPAAFLDD